MTHHVIKDININEVPNTLCMAQKVLMANIHNIYDDSIEDHELNLNDTQKVLMSLKGLAIIHSLKAK